MNHTMEVLAGSERPKILVFADYPYHLPDLKKILAELPIEIFCAKTHRDALSAAKENKFAVALIDIQLPEAKNFKIVHALHNLELGYNLPVVVISKGTPKEEWGIWKDEPYYVDFLARPVLPVLLRAKVRLVFENSRCRTALQHVRNALDKRVVERTQSLSDFNAQLQKEIEKRKLTQKSLEKNLAALEAAQRIARIGFYERNVQTGEGLWSDGVYRLIGVKPGGIPCTHEAFMSRVHPEDRLRVEEAIRTSEESQLPLEFEFRCQLDDGRISHLRAFGAIEYDKSDRPQFHRGILQDVTERKQAEQERLALQAKLQHSQKLESLGVLAGGIAHDFNNLLMAILGNADLALLKMSPVSPGRDNIQEVINASKAAAELCKQMLAYSGKGKFVIEKVDLAELAEEMTHMISVSISKKAVLKFNFAEGVPPIEADPSQVRQIIMNLVTNASEAIGDRSGVICVSTGMMHCDTDYLRNLYLDSELEEGYYSYLEVSDTGSGMDRETLGKLFDPFFSTKFAGRGLGLSAVLGIVRGHKGAIKPYSEPGKGTTFKVLFPALMEEMLAKSDEANESSLTAGWQQEGTVLVVDDEEAVCAISRGMLEHFGFKVLTAPDGREGLEVFKEHVDEIVCVLLDLTMPHMDGEECFRELRRLKSDVCVLLSSGYTEYDVESRFAGKGLAGFIQKPYTKAELEAAMRSVLALKGTGGS